MLESFTEGRLLLADIQKLAGPGVRIESNPDTWVSSTRRGDDEMHIRIGEQAVPKETLKRWRWGAETVEQQYLIKVAHEYAHVIQNHFDPHLLAWLGGANDVPQHAYPYIQLYALLAQTGAIHGLPQESVYHEQTRTTGGLDMRIYEDIAETLGSFLLGQEYFSYRLGQSYSSLTDEQKREIEERLNQLVEGWKRGRASR